MKHIPVVVIISEMFGAATALIKSFDLPNKLGQRLYSVVAKTHQNSRKGICILNRMETKRELTSNVNPVKNMAFCVCCPENDKLFQEQPFTSVYSRNKRAFLQMCKKEDQFFSHLLRLKLSQFPNLETCFITLFEKRNLHFLFPLRKCIKARFLLFLCS